MRSLPSRIRASASQAAAAMCPPAVDAPPCWNPSVSWNPEVEAYLTAALGAPRLAAISAATVRPPLATCLRVNTLRTTPDDVLRRLPDALTPEDRTMLAASGLAPYAHPAIPYAILVPGSGPHPVNYEHCEGREVIVGRKAGESMLRGANAYAPGILAVTAGINAGDAVAVSIGVELAETGGYGVTRGAVIPTNISLDDPRFPNRSELFIGVGRAEVSRSGFSPSASGLVLTLQERVFRSVSLNDALKGDVMLQNLPSLVAAAVLAPPPGARVLDMCASPGGKTTAMAQLMGNKGEIIALDRSHAKATHITALATELGVTIVTAYKQDATRAAAGPAERKSRQERAERIKAEQGAMSEKARKRIERLAAGRASRGEDPNGPPRAALTDGFDPESFDCVLLDAPCTALGLRPRLVLPQTMTELRQTAAYQRNLINTAVRLVKVGGTMVYSTCTINPGENEGNVRYLLDKYPFMRLVDAAPRLGGPGLTGSVQGGESGGGGDGRLLTPEEAVLVQRFDPSAELDTIGFFVAKFEKVGTSESTVEATE